MRDKISILYYPEMFVADATLMKSILVFDELHFMDRPSLMFGNFGSIGMDSPLRQYEASFRESGVPLYVHSAPMGPVVGEPYEEIKADITDRSFLSTFQNGIRISPTFRAHQVVPGNYGQFGNQDDVVRRITAIDLPSILKNAESSVALFEDSSVHPFDLSTPIGCAKYLISQAVICSAKLNFALNTGTRQGFSPLADAKPYGNLLGTKYARAIAKLEPAKNRIQVTDITFAIFDELIPEDRLTKLTIMDIIKYRKASEKARDEFLEHLGAIQATQAAIGPDGDYSGALDRLIRTEITPAAQTFRHKLQGIGESMFGAIAKGAVGYLGTAAGVSLFGDLSWEKLMMLAGPAGAYIVNASIDAVLAQRAARRECSISYLLSLDV